MGGRVAGVMGVMERAWWNRDRRGVVFRVEARNESEAISGAGISDRGDG